MDKSNTPTDVLAAPGIAQELNFGQPPTIVRILENNPGLFTGPGTNTFLVGDEALWIIDPGEDRDDGHHAAIEKAVAMREVLGILITHSHGDHWPLGARLAQDWQVPMIAFEESSNAPNAKNRVFSPQRRLRDGEFLRVPGGAPGIEVRLTCMHTPGHCADHIAFVLHSVSNEKSPGAKAMRDEGPKRQQPSKRLVRDRPKNGDLSEENAGQDTPGPVVLSGDHVMAWSTTILAPPDGSLHHYLASLDRLIALDPSVLLPAHGPAISNPIARMQELRDHRHLRTGQLLDALAGGSTTLLELVPIIYKDTNPALHSAAAASLEAHVRALIETGDIERRGEVLRLV